MPILIQNMKRQTMVCVVLPTYNNEETIVRAMDSVFQQDYDGKIILVVVPNGCTDKTEEKIQEYITEKEDWEQRRSDRIMVCNPYRGKGVVPSFNYGLECLQDELTRFKIPLGDIFVCRMDGDDAWHPNKIQKQIDFFEANPEVDILGAQMRFVAPKTFVPMNIGYNYPLADDEIKTDLFRGRNPIANPVAMYRWTVMDKAGRFEEIIPHAEDFWFWCKAAITNHTFANLPDVLMDYSFEVKPHSNPNVGQFVGQVAFALLQNKLQT